ncbi:MAG TPA: serine/threonine protein kinase [Kiritimatiellia bacterium]|nr:serine/threonine protein kinase [Kiritimatiellia bacterium]HMP34440.1 serine/threonine protein kinase [Kiritimatiellia bacterium]
MTEPQPSVALADFSHLTPDHVIEHVESVIGRRCTNLCRQLNSYINRVYEVQAEDGDWLIIKFYRPGRWSRAALQDEVDFLRELATAEVPVVTPIFHGDVGLHTDAHGVHFALFPRIGGRPLVEPPPERWIELGRLLARLHEVGARAEPRDRISLHPEESTADHLDVLLDGPFFPYESLRDEYEDAAWDIVDLIAPCFDDAEMIRIHGDCHPQNILDRPDEPLRLIDFDDMAVGPPIQDVWMLLPDRPEQARTEFNLFREGYETFRDLPPESLRLVEPLRAMRFIHYTAWCARQKADGGFNRLAPDWGSASHWRREIDELRRQLSLIRLELAP